MKRTRSRLISDIIGRSRSEIAGATAVPINNKRLSDCVTLDDVIALLDAPDRDLRHTTAWYLGQLRDKRAAPALIRALNSDPDIGMRQQCIDSLGFLGGKRGVPVLMDTLLNDPEVTLRERAASSLRFLNDPRIIDALVTSMANSEEESVVREMVAEAIGSHDMTKGIPVLIAALRDPSANVRFWSAQTLTGCADPSAIPELERLAREDTAVLYEPGPELRSCWGTVSTWAAEAAIQIKQDCGIELTDEETQYLATRKSPDYIASFEWDPSEGPSVSAEDA